jgi:hypothetical protein
MFHFAPSQHGHSMTSLAHLLGQSLGSFTALETSEAK